jgi:hypothetical protein
VHVVRIMRAASLERHPFGAKVYHAARVILDAIVRAIHVATCQYIMLLAHGQRIPSSLRPTLFRHISFLSLGREAKLRGVGQKLRASLPDSQGRGKHRKDGMTCDAIVSHGGGERGEVLPKLGSGGAVRVLCPRSSS